MFAMHENALVVAQTAQQMWFDFVFFIFGKRHAVAARVGTPRTFDDAFLARKIRHLHRVRLVSGAKNHPVAQVQRQHF